MTPFYEQVDALSREISSLEKQAKDFEQLGRELRGVPTMTGEDNLFFIKLAEHLELLASYEQKPANFYRDFGQGIAPFRIKVEGEKLIARAIVVRAKEKRQRLDEVSQDHFAKAHQLREELKSKEALLTLLKDDKR